jgi:hypothetical protein
MGSRSEPGERGFWGGSPTLALVESVEEGGRNVAAEIAMTVKKPDVQTAVKLLAKAESTDIDAEAIAFVERSYRLLAQIITVHDAEHGPASSGPRRRDRRHLQERRFGSSPDESAPLAGTIPADYRAVNDPSAGATHVIDLRM